MTEEALIDRFGRQVTYLRLSVTDRCDFRCIYCMAEDMTFLPRSEVLSLEELALLAESFVALGVKKIRLTGGEPLVRKNVLSLIERIGSIPALETLALTTNGARLAQFADPLKQAGVSRLNISLDSLQAEKFRALTRTGDLAAVIQGIDAAVQTGFERIKLNCVALQGRNDDELAALVQFAIDRQIDIAFIEEMPLGHVDRSRQESFLSSAAIRQQLGKTFTLHPVESDDPSAGPAREWQVAGTATRVGFISPHSHNFCASCNRVRLTVEGRLLLCLGNEHSVDLKPLLRNPATTPAVLQQEIREAMAIKPERHEFRLEEQPVIVRYMNETGG